MTREPKCARCGKELSTWWEFHDRKICNAFIENRIFTRSEIMYEGLGKNPNTKFLQLDDEGAEQ